MKFPLACADFTFPLLTHEQSLELISLLGFEGVDVGLFEGRSHRWPSHELADPAASGHGLAEQLSGRGLQCADLFLQMDQDFAKYAINHPEAARREKARDWFLRTLDYAQAAGSKHLTVLPGVNVQGEPESESWRRCCEELTWRLQRAAEHELTVSVEGHVGSIAPNRGKLARLLGDVPGLTLTLDYTHFTRAGVPDSEAEPLIRHASRFHVRGARPGRLQSSFAQNTIDYGRVLQVMRQVGYAGFVGVEYVWTDWEHCNEVDNLSETILFRDFLRRPLP